MRSSAVATFALVGAIAVAAGCGRGGRGDVSGKPPPNAMSPAPPAPVEGLGVEASTTAPAEQVWCGDPVLADQLTSGGERFPSVVPCWTGEIGVIARTRRGGDELRRMVRRHRHLEARLEAAEREACAELVGAEREHSPFAHREDVIAVERIVGDDGRLRGARVVFDRVPGLTVEWLRASITCHRARAEATGWEPVDLVYDPSVVELADVDVGEEPRGLVVEIVSDDPATAAVITSRAERLLDPDPRPERRD